MQGESPLEALYYWPAIDGGHSLEDMAELDTLSPSDVDVTIVDPSRQAESNGEENCYGKRDKIPP